VFEKLKHKINDVDTKEILTKGFSFLVFRITGLLFGYVFALFITRQYGAGVYGLVTLCFSLFLFISIFGRLGIDINLVKFYSNETNQKETGLFYRVLIKSIIVSSLLAACLYMFKDILVFKLFKKPLLEPYIIWIVLAIPCWSTTLICSGLLRAKKLNNWFAFLNNPGRFAFSLIAIVILWSIADNPLNAIKSHFYGVFFLAILSIIISIKTLKKISFKTNENSWVFLKDAFPMMLSSTMLIFLGWLDTFILGIYESEETIGIYGIALKFAVLTSFVLQAINSILAPKLANSYTTNDMDLFKKLIQFATKLNFFLTLIIVTIIVVFRKLLLGIYGEEFVAGSIFLTVLCIGQLVNSMSGSVGVIMQMTGHQKAYQNIVFVALIINLILNFTLIPIYGGLGAAIATVISISTWNIAGAIYIKLKLNIASYYNPF